MFLLSFFCPVPKWQIISTFVIRIARMGTVIDLANNPTKPFTDAKSEAPAQLVRRLLLFSMIDNVFQSLNECHFTLHNVFLHKSKS